MWHYLMALLLVATVGPPTVAAEAMGIRGIHYDPPRQAPALHGVDHNRMPWIFHRQPHPLALVMFGYVNCVDVCSTNLVRMSQLRKLLGPESDQVLIVFVTIDPAYETPDMMKEKLAYFGGEVIGLTGTEDELASQWASWNVLRTRVVIPIEEDPTQRGFKWDHTAQIHLVQGGKRLVVSYPYGTESSVMAEDCLALLKDPSLADKRLPTVGSVREIVIPAGAYTLAFQRNPSIPTYIRLFAGDTLVWKNDDYMYHFVGDIALAPGDAATITYDQPGDTYYLCTATPGEALHVSVVDGEAKAAPDAVPEAGVERAPVAAAAP